MVGKNGYLAAALVAALAPSSPPPTSPPRHHPSFHRFLLFFSQPPPPAACMQRYVSHLGFLGPQSTCAYSSSSLSPCPPRHTHLFMLTCPWHTGPATLPTASASSSAGAHGCCHPCPSALLDAPTWLIVRLLFRLTKTQAANNKARNACLRARRKARPGRQGVASVRAWFCFSRPCCRSAASALHTFRWPVGPRQSACWQAGEQYLREHSAVK